MALIGKPKDTASLSLFDRPAPAPTAPKPGSRAAYRALMATMDAEPVTHRFDRMPGGSDKCFQCGLTRDKHPSPARQAPAPAANVPANVPAGARAHQMFPDAAASVRGFNRAQFIFFAMTSRRDDARVVEACISKDTMARAAKRIGGVVKGGYVVDGVAYVMPRSP